MASHPFLLDGKWTTSSKTIQIRSPFDDAVVGETFSATPEQLEQAIAASLRAFAITRKMAARERQQILAAVASFLERDKEAFAHMIALEAGKPVRTARLEVERAIFTFSLAGQEIDKVRDEHLHLRTGLSGGATRSGLVRRFPIGPIAAITPFNFPLNLVAHKLAPAIAVGCPVVLKPAPQTPLTAIMLARLIQDAGWPEGALNVMPMANDVATPLIEDDRFKMLSFTGSAAVGWGFKARSGKKRVVLELGGNAAAIIHNDADLAAAASRCAVGGFSYAGQSCISVQRILVHKEVFAKFIDVLVPKVQALKSGDPLDETTDVGPLIRESDAERIEQWIQEAEAAGARVLCGGKPILNGRFIEPTILTGTSPMQRVNCEEIFGPVVTVESYDDFDVAIRSINASRYGLQAGIFTATKELLMRAFQELEVGGLIANDVPTYRSDEMPYGGVKDSGLGREGVRYAMEEMTDLKILVTD